MSLVQFKYFNGYHTPSSGSVVFMPHRRHAANETEVLPKPFHRQLSNGEMTVDLEPTEPTWVWSVTHNDTTLFYTIPETDGVTPHTDLIPVAPSTLPTANNAVEPAWWAEIRQYQQLHIDSINRASEAIDVSESSALEATEQAGISRHQASLSDGYMRQSRQYSYDSHDSADRSNREANRSENEADRSNREANRSESEADRSQNQADRSETAQDQTETVADDISESYGDWHGRIPALENKTEPLDRNHDDTLRVRDKLGYVAFEITGRGDVVSGGTTIKASDGYRIRDSLGRTALEVDSNGNTLIGGTPVQPSDGYRITDTAGQTALEIDSDGNTVIGGVPIHPGDGYRIRDSLGRTALEVDSDGNTVIGGVPIHPGDGLRIRDSLGRIALEVDSGGTTHIHDPSFEIPEQENDQFFKPVRTHSNEKFNPNPPEQVTHYPTHLDPKDRMTMINFNSSMLRFSRDEGKTWELCHTFDDPVRSGIIMGNGEVIVNIRGSGSTTYSELWLSKNWQENPVNAEWEHVHTFTTPNSYASAAFSWSQHDNIITVGEYGPKRNVGDSEHSAKFMYLSKNYGKTWETVLNLEDDAPNVDPNSEYGVHIHGTLFDPYWDRLWVTYGDSVHGGTDIIYSDNMGETWHSVGPFQHPEMSYQSVGMYALPHCVLFATDGAPNGVLRIDRAQGKYVGGYLVESAYRHDMSTGLTILCQSVWRAERPGDDAPVVFEFVSAPGEGRRFILTTYDGYEFNKIWESDIVRGNSSGKAFGPTASGRLLHYAVDEYFTSGGRTLRQGPMVNAY